MKRPNLDVDITLQGGGVEFEEAGADALIEVNTFHVGYLEGVLHWVVIKIHFGVAKRFG